MIALLILGAVLVGSTHFFLKEMFNESVSKDGHQRNTGLPDIRV